MKRIIAAVAVVLVMVSAVAYAYSLASVQHRRVLRADMARAQRTPTPTQTRAMQATGIPTTAAPSPERLRRGAPSRPTPVAPQVMSAAPSSPTPTATATSRPVEPPATAPPAAAVPTHTATAAATSRPTATPTRQPTTTAVPTARPTPPATVTVTAPATPTVSLRLGAPQFSLFTIDPQFTRQHISFTLSTLAHVWVRIAPEGKVTHVRTMDLGMRPAGTVQVGWNGRDNAGKLVPAGSYEYAITAKDATGAQQRETYGGLGITYKRIVVDLAHQRLTAYDGSTRFLTTLVTTGNPALPTPVGVFPILAKYSPFTFVSPWPPGSEYYYPPATANYALLFDNRGYYVHDAPWRSVFGPGTNTSVGTPGQNYTGTHGCVNVPLAAEAQLFNWATVGTVVQVVP